MTAQHILVIDDDKDVLAVMELLLAKAGFRVTTAPTAKDGLLAMKNDRPDLLVLDVMLPGMNGLELLRALKLDSEFLKIPVILHSSVGEEDVVVKALELGADDYVTKQTSPRLKLSRIQATIRRYQEALPTIPLGPSVTIHDIELFPENGKMKIEGKESALGKDELRIALLLVTQPGVLHTKDQILSFVRQEYPQITRSEVESAMSKFLAKLGRAERHIEKILGVGLRMKEPAV